MRDLYIYTVYICNFYFLKFIGYIKEIYFERIWQNNNKWDINVINHLFERHFNTFAISR